MDYRALGRSGLKVSPLCLGAMMFGAWGNRDVDDSVRIIHRALDAGINFIDTSNNYSDGESESIVGRALAEGGRRDRVVLATKVWAPTGEGPNERGLSRKNIFAAIEASLRRLGTDYVDLYQIHRPDTTTPWEETLSAFNDLVRQGKVLHIGCSTNHSAGDGLWEKRLPAWDIVETLWLSERHGYERFQCLQPPYSILRRVMETEHFPMCQRHGLGVIVWSPLEAGWLSGKYSATAGPAEPTPRIAWIGDLGNPKFDRRKRVVEALLPLAREAGLPLARLANAWALHHPAVSSVILGPRTMDQLEDSLQALEVRLSPELLATIDRLVPPGTSAL